MLAFAHYIFSNSFHFLYKFSDIWELGAYCRTKQIEYQDKKMLTRRAFAPGKIKCTIDDDDTGSDPKKSKPNEINDDPNIITNDIAFFRAHYDHEDVPKMRLYTYATRYGLGTPKYETKHADRLFRSVLTFNGKKYASTCWEKNKKHAEQGAALVCLVHIGIIDEAILIKNGNILK